MRRRRGEIDIARAHHLATTPRPACSAPLAPRGIFGDDIPGVQDAGDPAQQAEGEVNEELHPAAAADEHGEGRQDEGDECEAAAALDRKKRKIGKWLGRGSGRNRCATYEYHDGCVWLREGRVSENLDG